MRNKIVYEDEDILVCKKPAGMAVETKSLRQIDCVSELKNYLAIKNPKEKKEPYLGLIHRLDQPVAGLIVYAKNKDAAGKLSQQMKDHEIGKVYEAKVWGILEEKSGTLTHWMKKDPLSNTSFVVTDQEAIEDSEQVKQAILSYEVKEESSDKAYSMVKIKLKTGRHHQIRVQFSYIGHPLLGDLKYGSPASIDYSEEAFLDTVQLVSNELHFIHPKTGKQMTFIGDQKIE